MNNNVNHVITLEERKKQIAAYRANPEYTAMIRRIVERCKASQYYV